MTESKTIISTSHGTIAIRDLAGPGDPVMMIQANSFCREAFVRQLLAESPEASDAVTEESWVRLLDEAQGEGLLQDACDVAIRN